MSRCRRTDALLAVVFAGEGLTSAEADHAAGCPECARALALARRFDGELLRVGGELAAHSATEERAKGGRGMWRPALLAGTVVVAIVLAVASIQVWRDGPDIGLFEADGPRAEQLAGWLERSLMVAHGQAQPGGTSIEGWETARVEVCGDAVVAFFDRGADGSHGYLWAIGRPSDILDQSTTTGWSRTLSTLDVALLRAELPVCEVALNETRDPLIADVPVPPQIVARVPDFLWTGDPDDAPIEVEVVGGDRGDIDVGLARDGYLTAELDDASVRAVDIVSAGGRFRYTVGVPGFTVWANVVGDVVRFEFLNGAGEIVAAGAVVDLPADTGLRADRRVLAEQAEVAAAAEAARRAATERPGDGGGLGQSCLDWRVLSDVTQVLLTEELIADRLEAVRVAQQLAEGATVSEITIAAQGSLDKSCQGSPAGRLLTDIVEAIYPDE